MSSLSWVFAAFLIWISCLFGKTITNNSLLSSISAYAVRIILSIGGSRLFSCISVSCRVIHMDTHWFVYSRTN